MSAAPEVVAQPTEKLSERDWYKVTQSQLYAMCKTQSTAEIAKKYGILEIAVLHKGLMYDFG